MSGGQSPLMSSSSEAIQLLLFRLTKSLQSCPTVCDPMHCSPPGSFVGVILQAGVLQWVALPSSRGSSPTQGLILALSCLLHWQVGSLPLLLLSRFSRVRLCVTPQTAAHQAPPSLGFSRQEHWSGLPFPSPMHESGK